MKVSVLMPTYSHAATIGQAIESFLNQETGFSSELLISDDASPDNTAEIAKEYAVNFPDRIRFIGKKVNEGLLKNYRSLLSISQGQYIAILESDDYWTDPHKLAKQVSYLDDHPEYGLSFTRWHRLREGTLQVSGDESEILKENADRMYSYLLLRNIIFSPTVCFRRSDFDKYCDIEGYILNGFVTFDYPVWLSLARHTRIHYLSDPTAVYRVSGTSISNTKDLEKRLMFEYETARIRRYIIQLYGKGDLKMSQLLKREKIVRSRLCFRNGKPFRALTELFRG
jgi:glycosyltransferase involved in cell wall biosynthesis